MKVCCAGDGFVRCKKDEEESQEMGAGPVLNGLPSGLNLVARARSVGRRVDDDDYGVVESLFRGKERDTTATRAATTIQDKMRGLIAMSRASG